MGERQVILSLDLATSTGWAASVPASPSGRPKSGVWRLGTDALSLGSFFDGFDQLLSDAITVFAPRLIVYEAPILHSGQMTPATALKLQGLAALTELIAFRREVPVRQANNQTVKKFFAGYGHAKKPDMIAACRDRGWNIDSPDEADALAILAWAQAGFPKGGKAA